MLQRVAYIVLLALTSTANATVSELPRTDEPIDIDGVLDESVWFRSLQVELEYENNPGDNTKAPVKTVAYLTEDGRNLYIAFMASDPDPSKIRAWLRDRDSLGSSDYVGVSFDTYGDGRRAFEFFANPLGAQLDQIVDDVNGNNDPSWDAIWESAGVIGDDGYVVEMRIPLNQIRFQDVDGEQSWGYRLFRKYPRARNVTVSSISNDRDRNCKLCQYPLLTGLDGVEPGKNLEIVPTLTASQVESSESPGELPLFRGSANAEAGVTVRYGITSEISASLAINPDFSQIESDRVQLQINDRFSQSFEERRPFFLEGADYFSTPLQAVFTRSVVNPEFAGKITGKRGVNTVASFAALDEETALLFPGATGSDTTFLGQSNNTFVGRYGRAIGSGSQLGTLLTVRDGDEYRNIVSGFDARWRINDNHELTTQYLHSETQYPLEVAEEFDQPIDKFTGAAVVMVYTYDSRDWFADFEVKRIDDSFRADVGFMTRAGSTEEEYSFGRQWQSDEDWWTRLRLRGAYEVTNRTDGQLLEETHIVQFTMNGPLQTYLDLNMRTGREYDGGRMYDYDRVNVSTSIEPLGGLILGADSKFGDEIDFNNARLADQIRFKPFVRWSVNRHLWLRINSSKLALETKAGDQILDARVVDARMTWQFNLRSSVRLTLQQTEIDRNPDEYIEAVDEQTRDVGRQLLYSWKMNPQTVFFLGYSDAFVDNDDIDDLTASDRSWFMKVGYAWAL